MESVADKLKEIGINKIEDKPSKVKQKLQCSLCDSVFEAFPKAKLQQFKNHGLKGCPECVKKEKDSKTFRENVERVSHKVEVLSESSKTIKTKIKVKYKPCDHVHDATFDDLIHSDISCPTCSAVKRDERIIDMNKNNDRKGKNHPRYIGEGFKEFFYKEKERVGFFVSLADDFKYEGYDKEIKVQCDKCSTVSFVKPKSILWRPDGTNPIGCPNCYERFKYDNYKKPPEYFVGCFRDVHGDMYEYPYIETEYENSHSMITIECPKHGMFIQRIYCHSAGQGCPKCSANSYSKVAIAWLTSIEEKEGIKIQHAENEGEYGLPGTRLRVDGYCEETNTVYEFHGSVFHGDLRLFEESDTPHPFNKEITARELYNQTKTKEKLITDMGFNLVTMWEYDYMQKK